MSPWLWLLSKPGKNRRPFFIKGIKALFGFICFNKELKVDMSQGPDPRYRIAIRVKGTFESPERRRALVQHIIGPAAHFLF